MNPYGIIIVFLIFGLLYLGNQQLKNALPPNERQQLFYFSPWIIFIGIIGARLYHLIHHWSYYSLYPIKSLYIWHGGLSIFGAVISGVLAIYFFCRFKKLNFSQVIDAISLYFPLAQAIGRLGNYINQELYGLPADVPWAIYISPEHRLPLYQHFSRFHPLFAYEALADLFVFLLLLRFQKLLLHYFGQGSIFATWMLFYGIIRFCLEPLRINPWRIGPVSVAQAISIVMLVISFGFFILRRVKLNNKPVI